MNHSPFNLTWIPKGKEYRSEELSKRLDELCEMKIVTKIGNTGYKLTNHMEIPLDQEWKYILNSYFNSKYTRCHPREIDKQEAKLHTN
jgi:hypothetical protein